MLQGNWSLLWKRKLCPSAHGLAWSLEALVPMADPHIQSELEATEQLPLRRHLSPPCPQGHPFLTQHNLELSTAQGGPDIPRAHILGAAYMTWLRTSFLVSESCPV